jgi:MFS family permease
MIALAQMGGLFAVSWLLVLLAGAALEPGAALAALVVAIVVFSLGECLYDSVQGRLTADLAREALTGRYMAVNGFSWQLGFIVGPAAGAAILGVASHARGRPVAYRPCALEVKLGRGAWKTVREARLRLR